jgi:hypothetical protein
MHAADRLVVGEASRCRARLRRGQVAAVHPGISVLWVLNTGSWWPACAPCSQAVAAQFGEALQLLTRTDEKARFGHRLRRATCNRRRATCNRRRATRRATCNRRRTTCNGRRAACNGRRAACNGRRAACNGRRAACNGRRVACNRPQMRLDVASSIWVKDSIRAEYTSWAAQTFRVRAREPGHR